MEEGGRLKGAEGQSFYPSFWGSAMFLFFSALVALWSVATLFWAEAPELAEAIAVILMVGCAITAVVMIYRILVRPVMIRIDAEGLYLKNYDAVIPWRALEGARLAVSNRKSANKKDAIRLVELVPRMPLDQTLDSGKLRLGRSANQMAGLPDYCVSMDGIEGSLAELLAALSIYTKVLPPSDLRQN